MKKYFLKFFCYALLCLCFVSCENKLAITGIAAGFVYALLYCRENPFLVLIPYLGLSAAFNVSLTYYLYLLLTVFPAVVLCVAYYFFNRKFNIWVTLFCVLVSQIPKLLLYGDYVMQAVGCLVGVTFFYVSVVFLYPLLIRGTGHELSLFERSFMLIFFGVVGAGAYAFSFFGVTLFYPLVALVFLFIAQENKDGALVSSVAFGIGASLISSSFFPAETTIFAALVFHVFSSVHPILGGVLSVAGFVGIGWLWEGKIALPVVLSFAVPFLFLFVPKKYLASLRRFRQGVKDKFALRTVVNRDREDVGKKLLVLAGAFDNVREILCEEERFRPEEDELTKVVRSRVCGGCRNGKTCGERISVDVKNLVTAAIDHGKATPMDVGAALGGSCVALPGLLAATNDVARSYRAEQERKSGVEQGKEMIIGELGGTAELLRILAADIETGVGFDAQTERTIKEQLSYVNVVAGDVIIYAGRKEVSVTVREEDAKKHVVREIVSSVLGMEMTDGERGEEVGGAVTLRFFRMPRYGLVFGEASNSDKDRCGDTRRAIKLDREKIMFVLSDGMGTGEKAEKTSESAVKLIEAFYRAGFGHKTVFGCVSRLLSLRKSEDFSALDIIVSDTQTGYFDFIKQGGRESYIISDGTMETLEGGSLPLGILTETEPQTYRKKMRAGDVVIMISDGVADRVSYADMTELLASVTTPNPQVIAEKIIACAQAKPGKSDDMTSIVIRVVENK